MDSVFRDPPSEAEGGWRNKKWLMDRAILAARNAEVDEINDFVLDHCFPKQAGEEDFTLLSADSVEGEGPEAAAYPIEFLNTLNPSGLPPHKLRLRKGMPVMLLRNMNGSKGQANGTRLIVVNVSQFVLDCEIATGSHKGERVFIPRITLSPSEDGQQLPFKLLRRQFPVRPAFGMTINKAQGQTLQRVGLYLPISVFSHGQLYVALSRVGSAAQAVVLVLGLGDEDSGEVFVKNVVYKEVF